MTLPRFYPVVPDATWVEHVVKGGAKLVQLRIKDTDDWPAFLDNVSRAQRCCRQAGAKLVLNDYWDFAVAEFIDFVHLGQGDLDEADLPMMRRHGISFGISTHDEAELERALEAEPDYIALGPIYPTKLKAMPWAPQGLERITEWKRRLGSVPLVAIGGLTVGRIADVLAAGADSVAVVTDLVTAPDPDARIAEWVGATRPGNPESPTPRPEPVDGRQPESPWPQGF